ncbi:MAG: hypothetical protein ACRDZ4_02560 [Egibacteraceae bacterium]
MIHEISEIGDALAGLEPGIAADAAAALGGLLGDEGLRSVTQRRLQQFLWYELPMKWSRAQPEQLAVALSPLFDLLGRPLYAAICRSATTAKVLAAYDRDPEEGFRAFQDAERGSGIVPPDLECLVWGSVMGVEEAAAYESCASALELAVASGTLRPKTPGWRLRQRDIVADHLVAERDHEAGPSHLDAIMRERASRWSEGTGELRRRLLEPLLDQLLGEVLTPSGGAEAIEPLRWLLHEIGHGHTLTQSGRLSRILVVRAAQRFGWRQESEPGSAVEVVELLDLYRVAWRVGALRRSAHRLFLTPVGRRFIALPDALWRAVAGQLTMGGDIEAAVTELALAVILDAGHAPPDDLCARLTEILADAGWRDAEDGGTVRHALLMLLRPARLFGFVSVQDAHVALTDLGRAGALVALRDRATRPL